MKPTIAMTRGIATWLVARARENIRDECCGLLAGKDEVVTRAFSATNVASHPTTAYEIAPEELFGLMRQMRAAGLELLGIYHSHPVGENVPSARDVERAYYPDAAYFILSPRVDAQKPIRAFSIRDSVATELEIQIS
jgi:proteasome lid subunit RPN8/RPN11